MTMTILSRTNVMLGCVTVLVGCLPVAARASQAASVQVQFVNSCAPDVQSDFSHAVTLLHSFEYPEATRIFGEIIGRDPACGMARWGAAMSVWHPLWAAPSAAELERGAGILGGAIMLLPAFSQDHGTANAQDVLTFDGDTALWSITIKPDKTADFEQVMMKVREALMKSEMPQRKQQAAGWKVVKGLTAMPDGNIVYTHVISPVVRGADYTILNILYEGFPAEKTELYELYAGAFGAALGANVGTTVVDLSRP